MAKRTLRFQYFGSFFKDNEYQDKSNNINELIKKLNNLSKNLRTTKEKNNKTMNKKPLKIYDNEFFNISYKKSLKLQKIILILKLLHLLYLKNLIFMKKNLLLFLINYIWL